MSVTIKRLNESKESINITNKLIRSITPESVCVGYDITDDIQWISGNIVLNYTNEELQRCAKAIGLKNKKKWDKNKFVAKIFKRLTGFYDKKNDKELWVFVFLMERKNLFDAIYFNDLDSEEIIDSAPPEEIALTFRCMGMMVPYYDFLNKNKKAITANINAFKKKLAPYFQQDILSNEILNLRAEISSLQEKNNVLSSKLKNEQEKTQALSVTISNISSNTKNKIQKEKDQAEKYQSVIQDLKFKNRNLKKTITSLTEKQKTEPVKPVSELTGIVIWHKNFCCIATSEFYIPLSPQFLRENRLLNKDQVVIRNKSPLDFTMKIPSKERQTGEGVIECVKDNYVINLDTSITIGQTNTFLPINCKAQISYTPDGIGVVDRLFMEPQEETQIKIPCKKTKNIEIVYVAGGVKESIYRDIVPAKLLWTKSNEKRPEIITPNVQKADVVFVIIPYFSHNSYYLIKDACKKHKKPLISVGTTGQSGFQDIFTQFCNRNLG